MTTNQRRSPLSRLEGRRILVTGAASGIGEAISRLFVAEGARVALLDISLDKLERVAQSIDQPHFVVDVASEESVSHGVEAAVTALGALDGVINAAGILAFGPIERTEYKTAQHVIAVNLMGPWLVTRAALPHLRAAPNATIVNIASLAGLRPSGGTAIYSTSKAALIALTLATGGEAGATIRCNVICPGVIKTPMVDFMFEQGGIFGEGNQGMQSIQLRRAGLPEEVARTALFLTSDESSYVSMATLPVTGGVA
jgi:NAD(P)-dependent dehydrogenase (short-subunit alcohol dehydrogenase family)